MEADDLFYLTLSEEPVAKSKIVQDDFNYDFNAQGDVIGVEVINARFWFGDLASLTPEKILSKLLSLQSPVASAA